MQVSGCSRIEMELARAWWYHKPNGGILYMTSTSQNLLATTNYIYWHVLSVVERQVIEHKINKTRKWIGQQIYIIWSIRFTPIGRVAKSSIIDQAMQKRLQLLKSLKRSLIDFAVLLKSSLFMHGQINIYKYYECKCKMNISSATCFYQPST